MFGDYKITKLKKDTLSAFKLIGSLIVKDPINKTEHTDRIEDALKADNPIFAIADGAGGSGIFCGEWAAYLLDKLPEGGFDNNEDLTKWFDEISEEFNNATCQLIHPSQYFIEEKFSKEGSFSTLSAIWLKKNSFKYLSVGDSGIFGFKKQENGDYILSFLKPFSSYDSIDANPYLINWLHALNIQNLYHDEKQYEDLDIIILASDSISRFIISILLSLDRNFNAGILDGNLSCHFIDSISTESNSTICSTVGELLETLKNLTKMTSTDQYAYLKTLIIEGALQSDDFSLIILEK